MQPDPLTQQTVTVGQNIPMANPLGGGQVIYIQQAPSSVPTVIGILTCIFGVIMVIVGLLGLLGLSLLMDPASEIYLPEYEQNSGLLWISGIFSLVLCAGYLYGGFMITKRKKIGIYVAWASIAIITLINILIELIAPEISAADPNSFGSGFNIVANVLCSGICGALVAIPLMVETSNMVD